MRRRSLPLLLLCALLAACDRQGAPPAPIPGAAAPASAGPYAALKTSKGVITARLFGDKAPRTVANFVQLAKGAREWRDPRDGRARRDPYYNGVIFHRVIPGFMIQTGDPLGNGTGGPGYEFADEFHPSLRYDRPGLLGMANYGPHTNGGQFFITLAPTPHLNDKHSIFGEVIGGQAVVEAIAAVPRSSDGSDRPLEPITIESVTVSEKAPR